MKNPNLIRKNNGCSSWQLVYKPTHNAMIVLFFKSSEQHDLFGAPVKVRAYTRRDGVFVKEHTVNRRKKKNRDAPEVTEEEMRANPGKYAPTPDMFSGKVRPGLSYKELNERNKDIRDSRKPRS